jgi:hypothetical protein
MQSIVTERLIPTRRTGLAAYAEAGSAERCQNVLFGAATLIATDMPNKGLELPDSLARKYGREGIQATGH